MTRNTTRSIFAVMALAGTVGASPIVNLDFIVLQNGTAAVFGDGFDSGVMESPPWYVVTGSPGPESGTTLTLQAGDMIATPIAPLDPALDTTIFAGMDLIRFSGNASAALILLGDEPGESLTLAIVPLAAYLIENGSDTLGIGPALTFGSMHFEITLGASGNVNAEVNGITVFDDALDFGPLTGIAFGVIPEPSTLVLLGLGLVVLVRRKRAGRLTLAAR